MRLLFAISFIVLVATTEPSEAIRRARAKANDGLPGFVTCSMVREARSRYSDSELREMAKQAGVSITPKMEAEARACAK